MNVQNYDLSVVIISRNEEKNIANCIESVLKATEDIDVCEIVLVDSASTDKTVEIATKYPIKIFQLDPSFPLSPAAGYYIGFLNTKGRYVQFQCGDSILNVNWFKIALPILKNKKKLAGIVGMVIQEPYDTRIAKKYAKYHNNLPIGEIQWFAADSLFKRDVLLEVGTFNPYLLAGEEGELSYRVIDSGYKLLRLPDQMSHHLGGEKENYLSIIKKKLRYTKAQGQILRYSTSSKLIFLRRLKEYKFKLISIFLILFGLFSINLFLLYNTLLPLYILIGGIIFYFGWIFYYTRNLKETIFYSITQALRSIPFILGFLQPKKNPETYPTDVKIIKY